MLTNISIDLCEITWPRKVWIVAHPLGTLVGLYPVMAGMVYLLKPGSQHWGLCIPRQSESHVNVGPVSIWVVKEPARVTGTLAPWQ